MTENIDNLLDDLDALINSKSSPVITSGSTGGALPYKVPHRPANEKSPTQLSHTNPKTKFVSTVPNNSSNCSTQTFHSENIKNQNYPPFTTTGNDVESLDDLLDLLHDSPMQNRSSSSTTRDLYKENIGYSHPVQHSGSSCCSHLISSGQRNSQADSFGSSASFPVFESMNNNKEYLLPSDNRSARNQSVNVDSFDSLLSDINNALPPVSPNGKTMDLTPSSSSATLLQPPLQSRGVASKGSRCTKVVIAGTAIPRGVKGSAFSKSACDRLRCLNCNFEAIQFSGYKWSSEVDYMFFRNNMPNRQKLGTHLVECSSSVAYCCQCSWISSEEELVLSPGQQDKPQWVCAGH